MALTGELLAHGEAFEAFQDSRLTLLPTLWSLCGREGWTGKNPTLELYTRKDKQSAVRGLGFTITHVSATKIRTGPPHQRPWQEMHPMLETRSNAATSRFRTRTLGVYLPFTVKKKNSHHASKSVVDPFAVHFASPVYARREYS
ncbi:hypothetical protein BDN67DRAFT_201475 [Paxillus ammoniavirescens]|nr:hypothetical protein BDN67DRAFT_201475 [Paxillus ammoniavirescens]